MKYALGAEIKWFSGLCHHIALEVDTSVSEEYAASIFKVEDLYVYLKACQ
jgi:hypothetical protein